MNRVSSIPDLSHLEQLRKRLWEGKEYGRAAVMVGAGFSRNAEPKAGNAPSYPLWNELAGCLYEELYPPGAASGEEYQRDKLRRTSGGGVLKLAQEYKTWFGRERLNKALLDIIPYRSYRPGILHRLLLSLPWSDVFTTNYDTLLEEALPSVYYRKYDVCLTMDEIPLKMKPRLVKLHGSFPSHTPFIITEEDYRRYPSRFAPFVNMVQQALMENALCLIGFSGDDPNFLNWTGWVRDNLKEHTPTIYLCGILNLSSSRRKVLQDRRIIPIDLSHLPLDQDMDSALKHEKALEWLLLSLLNGKPEDRRNWPVPSAPIIETPSDGLPPILPRPTTMSDISRVAPQDPPDAGMLQELLEAWKDQREQYPGWVVCPKQSRSILWFCTQHWLSPVAESMSLVKPWIRLFLLRELNWRLERCLVPLGALAEKVKQIVISFNPFAGRLDLPDAEYHSDDIEWQHLDWEEIRVSWVELVFALARKAREKLDQPTFLQWLGLLEKVVPLKKDWLARHWYEDCLFSLFSLDPKTLREKLDNCPVGMDFPLVQAKRASMMAEVGRFQEARRLAQEALDVIRYGLSTEDGDYCSLSQEGWLMLSIHLLARADLGLPKHNMPQQRDRWEKLSTLKCNPSEDLDRTSSPLRTGPPLSPPAWEEKVEFDPGRRMRVTNFEHDSEFEKCLPAFQFLRLLEDGGCPVNLGGSFDLWNSATINAAKWIGSREPFLAIGYMIRDYNHQEIKAWFNRVRVAIMDQEMVEKLYKLVSDSLKQVIHSLNRRPDESAVIGRDMESRLVGILPEILSRLCFRLSGADRAQLFDLVTEMYELRLFTSNWHLHEEVRSLLERILFAMEREEILERMPTLLSLPMPEETRFLVSMPGFWVEPFECARLESLGRINHGFDLSSWQEPIRNLLRIAEEGTSEARTRALLRLERLERMGALDVDQHQAFATALWSNTDLHTQLPSNTSFPTMWGFLFLPELESGRAKELFRRHILASEFPRVINKKPMEEALANPHEAKISLKRNEIIPEILWATLRVDRLDHENSSRFVDWTTEEVIQILSHSAEWWDQNKPDLKDPEIVESRWACDELRKELSELTALFADVILPKLVEAQASDKALALRIIQEMENEGFYTALCSPAMLFVDPAHYDPVARRLRIGLNSVDTDEVMNCIEGLIRWFLYGQKGTLPMPPDDLFRELVIMVATRRQPGLELAMQKLSFILERAPDQLSEDMVRSLCVGLEYLKKETELPVDLDKEATSGSRPTIPIQKRPDCRKNAADLAHALHDYFLIKDLEIPSIISEWREVCRSDRLPEVRRAWSESSTFTKPETSFISVDSHGSALGR